MIFRRVSLLVLAGLLACSRSGEHTKPLVFTKMWLHGSVAFDERAARSPGESLPITVTLRMTDGSEFMRDLGLGQIHNIPCHEVRVLHRRTPNEPPTVLSHRISDLWGPNGEAAEVCWHTGTEWSWRLLVEPGLRERSLEKDRRLVVVPGNGRSATEEFSVLVRRLPKEMNDYAEYHDLDKMVVARSAWVSLREP